MSSTNPLADMSPERQRAMLKQLLEQRVEKGKTYPMSQGQQGLWYMYRRDPSVTTFNSYLPSRVRSELNLDALRLAIEYLVERHPCLRTTFSDEDAKLLQHVHDDLKPEFHIVDAQDLDEEQMRVRVIDEVLRPFDLENGPLLRLTVFEHRRDDFVIIANTHHIVVDFWSLILILSELRECYPAFLEHRKPDLPPAQGNYAEFVERQQELLAGQEGDRLGAYWQQALDGTPTVLEWPTDYARPAGFTGRAGVVPLTIPSDTSEKILRMARQAGTTINAVVLAAIQAFIYRYTNQRDFLIGSPFLGREHASFENTVGFFANMLPLRADLSNDPTILEIVQRAGANLLGALEHQSYPLEQIVRQVDPPRDPSRSPLLQVSCTFEKAQIQNESGRAGFLLASQEQFDFGGLQQESYYIPHPTCLYDIEFVLEPTENQLRGIMNYCRDLFTIETATQMARNFESLLDLMLDSPQANLSDVSWQVPIDVDRFRQPNPDPTTLVDLLDELPGEHIEAIATEQNGVVQTHGQLLERSKAIARQLFKRGIGGGDFVPVVARQGPVTAAAILGVFRSGAAVVPIDSDQPAVSATDLLNDTNAKLVIVDQPSPWTNGASVPLVTIEQLSLEEELPDPVAPEANDLAYVVYTSGSTGRPKGAMIQHNSLVNFIRARHEKVGITRHDRFLLLMSHQFDAGLGTLLIVLTAGASVIWADSVDSIYDFDRMIDQLRRDRISVLLGVPSWLRSVVKHPGISECEHVDQVWCGGESMPPELPDLVRQHLGSARIWNYYGPTETAVEVSSCEVVDHDSRRRIPIGTPIANTELLILNEKLLPVPDTVPGQLAVVGYGLGRGYLNQPELTREKFVPIPGDATGELRMYLTGDQCRRRADGMIEFLGRIDNQVKLRGYRIELEEIESVLQLHPSVANAAVKVIRPDTPGANLIGYVTRNESQIRESEFLKGLKRYVAEKLPGYKRPASIAVLEELPMGANGKVLRHQLPDVDLSAEGEFVAPSTPLEIYLASRWSEMLGLDEVGINQNFFQLGGSSLQAAMMTAQLSEDLGVPVPTALLFDLADIAKLCHRLAQLYETEMAERFGRESVIAYGGKSTPFAHLAGEHGSEVECEHPLLAGMKTAGNQIPVFMVHPPGGIVVCYRELAEQLSDRQPFYAIRSRGLHGQEELPATLEAMAADYIRALKTAQPHGPYVVGGWSLGGLIAYEIAHQLVAAGDRVKRLILLDTTILPGISGHVAEEDQSEAGLEYGIDMTLNEMIRLKVDEQLPFLWQHAVNLGVLNDETPEQVVKQLLDDLKALFNHHIRLTNDCRLEPLDVQVLLVRPRDVPFEVTTSKDRGWGQLVREVQVEYVAGHHHSMVQMPQAKELAEIIEQNLA